MNKELNDGPIVGGVDTHKDLQADARTLSIKIRLKVTTRSPIAILIVAAARNVTSVLGT